MRKRIEFGLLFLVIVFLLQGCSIERMDQEKVADVDFTIMEDSQIPAELQSMIEEKKMEAFKMTFDTEEAKYIVVGYGQQQTGGYSISIDELYLTNNAVYVNTTLIGPGKGEAVVEAASYPYIVMKIAHTDKNVVFE